MSAVFIAGGVAVLSVVAELCFGAFPVDIFRFSLNIFVAALWLMLISVLYRNRAGNVFARFMLSRQATWMSLALMSVIGIVLGLQREPSTTAWPVVASLLFVLSHLCFVILRGWHGAKGIRWRFTLLHAGLIIALGAGFWGSPDRVQLRTMLQDKPVNHAYHLDSTLTNLDYTMQLEECNTEYNTSGMPTHFEAKVSIDNEIVTLKVNHPYNRTFDQKIYLVSINQEHGYCIVEIVREPWQWASLAGIILILAGAVMLFIRGPRHMANKKMK